MKRQAMTDEELKDNKKNKQMDDDTENEDSQMEDEEKSCGTKKSQDLTEDDLSKAINVLNDFVTSSDSVSRKEVLLKKAMTDDLSSEEMNELFKSLSNSENVEAEEVNDFSNSILDSLESDAIQKSLDVSDYLTELHSGLVKSLSALEGELNGNAMRQHTFNITLAKSMVSVATGLKDVMSIISELKKSMDNYSEAPIRKPTSVQPLNKAFAGQKGQEGQSLSKSEMMGQLLHLAEQGINNIGGVNVNHAVALLESSNQLPNQVVNALKARQGATA
jgi:hypothetical protein